MDVTLFLYIYKFQWPFYCEQNDSNVTSYKLNAAKTSVMSFNPMAYNKIAIYVSI